MNDKKQFFKTTFLTVFFSLSIFNYTINAQSSGTSNCLVNIGDNPNISANAVHKVNSIFHFDYKIISNIKYKKNGETKRINHLKYYVNTKDGSIFFPKDELPSDVIQSLTGSNSSMSNDDMDFNSAVWLSNGQLVLFIKLKNLDNGNPKRAFTTTLKQTDTDLYIGNHTVISRFFNDIADKVASQDHLEPLPSNSIWKGKSLGYTAEIVSSTASAKETMYIDFNPTPITTGSPMIGFLVGVIKDWRIEKCNRLVVFNKIEPRSGEYIQAELIAMTRQNKTFNATSYKPTGLLGGLTRGAGTEIQNVQVKMAEFQNQMLEISRHLQNLKKEKRRCLNTSNGEDSEYCHNHFDPQIKRAKNQMKELQKKMVKSMGMEDMIDNN